MITWPWFRVNVLLAADTLGIMFKSRLKNLFGARQALDGAFVYIIVNRKRKATMLLNSSKKCFVSSHRMCLDMFSFIWELFLLWQSCCSSFRISRRSRNDGSTVYESICVVLLAKCGAKFYWRISNWQSIWCSTWCFNIFAFSYCWSIRLCCWRIYQCSLVMLSRSIYIRYRRRIACCCAKYLHRQMVFRYE